MTYLTSPWHWAFSGFMIVFVMALLLFFGRSFGVSSTLRTMCSATGVGKKYDFFNFDWKSQIWNIVFILGAVIGGYIGTHSLASQREVQLSEQTIQDLSDLGFQKPSKSTAVSGYLPAELFSVEKMTTKSFLLLIIGGFLIGFGARYAGGCTSGHAISGLANLQLPSLIAVIGFFIGGLFVTHVLMPIIFS